MPLDSNNNDDFPLRDMGDSSVPGSKPATKRRQRVVFASVAGAVAIALTIVGVTFGITQSRIANYDAAVKSHNAALTALIDTELKFTTKSEEFSKLNEENEQGLVADIDVAAQAPESLVSVVTNAPVVALTSDDDTTEVKASSSKGGEAENAEEPPASASASAKTEPPTPLPTSDSVKVTPELVISAERADAKMATQLKSALKKVAQIDADLEALNDFALKAADAVALAATEALKNRDAWISAHEKADAIDLTQRADELKKSLDSFTATEAPSADSARELVKLHAEFLTAAQNLKNAHDAVVIAEAEAAAQAAIDAQNQAPQWSSNSGYWGSGNTGSGGSTGGSTGSGGSGGGGSSGGGGVIPGGGNNSGGGCVTDNGMGGTMPCP